MSHRVAKRVRVGQVLAKVALTLSACAWFSVVALAKLTILAELAAWSARSRNEGSVDGVVEGIVELRVTV